jgi:hypothetical protein
MAREVVREEVLGGVELTARSAVWGNNCRRLPLVRCSWRNTMAGASCGPASLAGVVGRFLVLEGHDDEALPLVRSDNSEAAHRRLATLGELVVGVEKSNEEAAIEWCEGEADWVVASSGDVLAQG